jgi:hypothetical protein
MTDDINSVFWCPQCGRGACSQEDGTCSVCGSDIILPQVVSTIARAAVEEEREQCAVECVNVAEHYRKKCWDEAWEGAMDCADTIRSREPDAQDERDGGGCDAFERGAPSGDCEGDGHYECRECRSRAAAGGQGRGGGE